MNKILIFIIAILLIERFDVLNKEPISSLINPITYLSCRDDTNWGALAIFSPYSKHAYDRKNLYEGWNEYKNKFNSIHNENVTFGPRYIIKDDNDNTSDGATIIDKDEKILTIISSITFKKYTFTCKIISESQFKNEDFKW